MAQWEAHEIAQRHIGCFIEQLTIAGLILFKEETSGVFFAQKSKDGN